MEAAGRMALPRYLSVHAVAELLSCSYDSALRVVQQAGGIKVRGLVRISEDALASYLQACPSARPDHASTPVPVAEDSSARSTETSGISPLEPTIVTRPNSDSPISSSVAQLRAMRRRKAS